MAKHKAGAIFISYRRDDAGAETRAVRDAIDHAFDKGACFFDTNAALGTEWPGLLREPVRRGGRESGGDGSCQINRPP
jgi:hypothetical protein